VERLFIEFYLDEDVHVLIAEILRGRGFSAHTTLDAGRLGSTDIAQLDYAATHEKALLTHNRVDFERLAVRYAEDEKVHWGIVIAARRTPYEIVRLLLPLLDTVTCDEMRNQLRYI
jgi:predicted nuclease of predicted toxin-antitoxin system